MKKLFYACSLVLFCGSAAFAGNFTKLSDVKKTFTHEYTRISKAPVKKSNTKSDKTGAKAEAKTFEDFEGAWQWTSENLDGGQLPYEGVMTISKQGDDIIITGLDYMADAFVGGLKGYMKGEWLMIPNQPTMPNEDPNNPDSYGGGFFNWTYRHLTPDEEKQLQEEMPGEDPNDYIMRTRAGEFHFSVTDGGNIRAGINAVHDAPYTNADYLDMVCIAAEQPVSDLVDEDFYYWSFFWWANFIHGPRIEEFTFFPNEWVAAGTAQFQDPWFSLAFDLPNLDKAYNVPLMRNVENPYLFLLQDPYGANSPYAEVNQSPEEGYIVFDIAEPDCVVVKPFVYAATFNMLLDPNSDPVVNQIYPYNEEGYYYYIQGTDIQKLINLFDQDGRDLSFFQTRTRTVNIFNPLYDLIPSGGWGNPYGFQGASGYIVLPENYDAVESIISDNSNAPVEYFNLQGVKVVNPEKGQIVIVRQGNQATKTIVR